MDFTKHTKDGFTYLTAPNIDTKHAFTTRYGEPGNGKFSGQSMAALCRAINISPDSVLCVKQVHGVNVQLVTNPAPQTHNSKLLTPDSIIEADALITQTCGIALMVFTADCVPILLHDPVQGAIGAVHAGWRGTTAGIAAAAVERMTTEFGCAPADIHASIGPCISKCCFETDSDVADAVRLALPEHANTCIARRNKKYMIDLKETNRIILTAAGVRDITISGDCTACGRSGLRSEYWSHRRQGRNRGSQAAIIVMDSE